MPEPLDYAGRSVSKTEGGYRAGAVVSFCLGVAVCAEALWAVSVGLRLRLNADTEAWSVLGGLLLVGALVAAVGLAIAVLGRFQRARPTRFRLAGGILNALYLFAYVTLLIVVINMFS